MGKITEVLNKHFSLHAGATQEEFRAHIQSELNTLNRLFSELERPEFREYIRFAIAWQDLERELTALRVKIKARLTEKPINSVNEFLAKLKAPGSSGGGKPGAGGIKTEAGPE